MTKCFQERRNLRNTMTYIFSTLANYDKLKIYVASIKMLTSTFNQRPTKPRQKWNAEKQNFEEGDVVLLKNKDLARNQWPMAKVADMNADEHGLVRSVQLRMPNRSILERPIQKLLFLLEAE